MRDRKNAAGGQLYIVDRIVICHRGWGFLGCCFFIFILFSGGLNSGVYLICLYCRYRLRGLNGVQWKHDFSRIYDHCHIFGILASHCFLCNCMLVRDIFPYRGDVSISQSKLVLVGSVETLSVAYIHRVGHRISLTLYHDGPCPLNEVKSKGLWGRFHW